MDHDEGIRYSESLDQLRQLTEAQLTEKHDALIAAADSRNDPSIYYGRRIDAILAELARREAVRQGTVMETLTRSLNRLTWVITVATIVGVCLTAAALVLG